MAGFFAVQSQTLRAFLVLLFAILAALLTTIWHHVLGIGDALKMSHGQGMVPNGAPGHSAKPAAAGQTPHRPRHAGQARTTSASRDTPDAAAEPSSGYNEPQAGVHSGGRRQTNPYDARAASSAHAADRWRASHIALSVLPLLAFLWVCVSPVGDAGPRDFTADQARLGSVTERAPAASTATPQAHAEALPPRTSVQRPPSPPSGPERTKRGSGRRAEVGARAPP
jgi:hypothetical protein